MPEENRAAERFWSKVDKSGDCWIWTAATDRKGYGKFSVGPARNPDGSRRNSMVGAHRFSYELANGPIPDHASFHGLCVLHQCDNPRCVNPAHLFLGTNEENVKDMDLKGRRITKAKRGSAHAQAVLTEQKVREIHARYRAGGISQAALAAEYGVCLATINHIMTGRLWAHLKLQEQKAS
ncbi:hypothetical protein HMPREF3289_01280 [Pseudomonas sp. HMSC75E02]|uniref:HNH endonuclease n=1 Tax=Pseudomonas sp. HMSC75E02 TaxID=1608908 RepID=UPI0008A9CBB2|nr:HNH endonuclease [Pseudomonas sp. HMSC75E02]OHS09327.1 hypothetical protein HMPREF3289_01280 [Pseudomonas sp. HMSC75E02]